MSNAMPDELLEQMAENFRLLGDPTRLAIVQLLMGGERNVSDLVERTGQSQANVSKHLKLLARAGLATRRKEGLHVFYRVGSPWVARFCRVSRAMALQEFQERLDRQGTLLGRWGHQAAGGADVVEE